MYIDRSGGPALSKPGGHLDTGREDRAGLTWERAAHREAPVPKLMPSDAVKEESREQDRAQGWRLGL